MNERDVINSALSNLSPGALNEYPRDRFEAHRRVTEARIRQSEQADRGDARPWTQPGFFRGEPARHPAPDSQFPRIRLERPPGSPPLTPENERRVFGWLDEASRAINLDIITSEVPTELENRRLTDLNSQEIDLLAERSLMRVIGNLTRIPDEIVEGRGIEARVITATQDLATYGRSETEVYIDEADQEFRTMAHVAQEDNMNEVQEQEWADTVPTYTGSGMQTPIPIAEANEEGVFEPASLPQLPLTFSQMSEDVPANLNDLLAHGYLVPKSRENWGTFVAEQREVFEVLGDMLVEGENPLMQQFFKKISKGHSVRMPANATELQTILVNWRAQQLALAAETQRAAILENADEVLNTMLKATGDTFQIPKFDVREGYIQTLQNLDQRVENETMNAEYAFKDYQNKIRAARDSATEAQRIRTYLKTLSLDEGDLFDAFREFCAGCDGVKFPYKYLGLFKPSATSVCMEFLFERQGLTIIDPDTELPWIVQRSGMSILFVRNNASSPWSYSVQFGRNKIFWDHILSTESSVWTTAYFHPHISTNRGVCLGNAASMIAAMGNDLTKVQDNVLVIDSLLRTYNPASPYMSITNWHKNVQTMLYRICSSHGSTSDSYTRQKWVLDLKEGRISIQEYMALVIDKFRDVYQWRLHQELKSHSTPTTILMSTLRDRIRRTSNPHGYGKGDQNLRPFSSADYEEYFTTYSAALLSVSNIGEGMIRFLASVGHPMKDDEGRNLFLPENISALIDLYFHKFKESVLTTVQNLIDNYEAVQSIPEHSVPYDNYTLNGHNFKTWFMTIRKK